MTEAATQKMAVSWSYAGEIRPCFRHYKINSKNVFLKKTNDSSKTKSSFKRHYHYFFLISLIFFVEICFL